MSDHPFVLKTVAASATALAISSGSVNAALTLLIIPRFLELPAPLNVRGWHNMFSVTKWWVAGPMVLSGLGFYYVANGVRQTESSMMLFATAGTLCLSIVPFTRLFVLRTIHKLYEKLEDTKDWDVGDKNIEEKGESTQSLISKWGTFNMGRAIPVLSAGFIGLYALLSDGTLSTT
jgi:hypothetical protein